MLNHRKCIGTIGRMFGNTLPDTFVDPYIDLFLYSQQFLCGPNEYIHRVKAPVSWFPMGRNHMVQEMRGEWLLSLDTDHSFAPDLLDRLLHLSEKYNAGVVSGIYQTKVPPHHPVAGLWTDEGRRVSPIADWDRTVEIMPVGVVGGGCLLVQARVFDRIYKEMKEQPFDLVPGLSEDYGFCWRCRELGIPVFLAPQIECHHVIPHVLSVRDYHVPHGIAHVTGNMAGTIEPSPSPNDKLKEEEKEPK